MARRRTWMAWALLGVATAATPAVGAVSLASLGGASVQTLIDLGGDGVTAGGERYADFSYVATAGAPPASAVRVQATADGGADSTGLRFVAAWLASGGSTVDGTISYDVTPVDPARDVGRIALFTNGTAPVPATGTFVTDTIDVLAVDGTPVAPLLSTFDDGRGVPVDTTAPDVDAVAAAFAVPQPTVSVTDTLFVASSSGGVATASVVQTVFTTVSATQLPEPAVPAGMVVVAGVAMRRRVRGK